VGGGNSAVDAARVALRLGAREVSLLYRRSRAEMPANEAEVEEALAEGVKMEFLAAPTRIAARGGALEMECLRMKLGEPDASGRPRPEPIAGSEFVLSADTVISAIGQAVDLPTRMGLAATDGVLEADPETLATRRAGVYAGGDATSGPASVIEAIAAGRKAAVSIDSYLGGSGDIEETLTEPEGAAAPLRASLPVGERGAMPELELAERLQGFAEIELGLEEEASMLPALRCLRCDLPIFADPAKCAGCLVCELRCSLRLEGGFSPGKARIKIRRLVGEDTEYSVSFTDECDLCGICARYCPYGTLTREKKA